MCPLTQPGSPSRRQQCLSPPAHHVRPAGHRLPRRRISSTSCYDGAEFASAPTSCDLREIPVRIAPAWRLIDAEPFGVQIWRQVMRNRLVGGFLVAVALLLSSGTLFAHHGNAAYDSKTVTVKGTV